MAVVTVKKAAELAGFSQNTLFKAIRSGKLSKTADGKGIDTSEIIRVYGQLHDVYEKGAESVINVSKGRVSSTEPNASPETNQANERIIQLLEAQVKDLQERADRADSREQQLMELLKSKLLEKDSGDSVISRFKKKYL